MLAADTTERGPARAGSVTKRSSTAAPVFEHPVAGSSSDHISPDNYALAKTSTTRCTKSADGVSKSHFAEEGADCHLRLRTWRWGAGCRCCLRPLCLLASPRCLAHHIRDNLLCLLRLRARFLRQAWLAVSLVLHLLQTLSQGGEILRRRLCSGAGPFRHCLRAFTCCSKSLIRISARSANVMGWCCRSLCPTMPRSRAGKDYSRVWSGC